MSDEPITTPVANTWHRRCESARDVNAAGWEACKEACKQHRQECHVARIRHESDHARCAASLAILASNVRWFCLWAIGVGIGIGLYVGSYAR